MMLNIILQIAYRNYFSKRKAELGADPEAEALPETLTLCWKRKCRKRKRRKRKLLGWKRKRKSGISPHSAPPRRPSTDFTVLRVATFFTQKAPETKTQFRVCLCYFPDLSDFTLPQGVALH
jgi:ribosomal protein S8E